MLPGLSSALSGCVVLHWVQIGPLRHFPRSRGSRGGGCHSGSRGRGGSMFGDAPCCPAHRTVAGSRVFGRAALAASCWLAGVE